MFLASDMDKESICLLLLLTLCYNRVPGYYCAVSGTVPTLGHAAEISQQAARKSASETSGTLPDNILSELARLMAQEVDNELLTGSSIPRQEEGTSNQVSADGRDNSWNAGYVPGYVMPAAQQMPVTSKFGAQIARLNTMS